MKNKLLIILLLLTFLKGIVWLLMTPIFQVPDEASHFSRIQAISETRQQFNPRRIRPTSEEILKVSEIINFNWNINHPMWLGYNNNWRQQLKQISLTEKKVIVHNDLQTAAKRPALYYWISSPFYLLFQNQPFIVRFFSVRFFSILINLITVYAVFLLAQQFFKKSFLPLAIASLTAFQPMLSFIDIGVHYDPLTILVATVFLYQALIKHLRQAFLLALLGVFINPNLICLILLYPFFLSRRKLKFILPVGVLSLIILAFLPRLLTLIIVKYHFFDPFLYLININEYSQQVAFFFQALISGRLFSEFLHYLAVTGKMNLAQVFPWYWGVFGWLEKTMPLIVYTIIKIVISISLIGWLKFIFSRTKIKGLRLLILASVINLGVVVLNDFLVFAGRGSNFGIQGRYLLPMISAHMILLVFGLSQLIPIKYHHFLAAAIIIAGFILNLVGLVSLYQFFGWVWS